VYLLFYRRNYYHIAYFCIFVHHKQRFPFSNKYTTAGHLGSVLTKIHCFLTFSPATWLKDHVHISDFDSKITFDTGVISLQGGKYSPTLCKVQRKYHLSPPPPLTNMLKTLMLWVLVTFLFTIQLSSALNIYKLWKKYSLSFPLLLVNGCHFARCKGNNSFEKCIKAYNFRIK
jgi:hypothetical protein